MSHRNIIAGEKEKTRYRELLITHSQRWSKLFTMPITGPVYPILYENVQRKKREENHLP